MGMVRGGVKGVKFMHYVLDARTATHHFPGIGRYVANLARTIAPLLDSSEKLTLLHDPTQPTSWNFQSGERVQVMEVSVSPFSLRQQWLIPDLLKNIKATLYHSPYYLMPYRLNIHTILTIYDVIPQRYPKYVSFRAKFLTRVMKMFALRTANHCIAISKNTKQDFVKWYRLSAKHITVIPLAADSIFYPRSQQEIATVKERLMLPEAYILYVGSNKPHKNLLGLIQAWEAIQPQLYQLVIGGAWDKRYPQARKYVEHNGLENTVYFIGRVSDIDLPMLYSGATCFVFPSEYEGFGLPALEAMACGTPVVCSNTSSLPEVVNSAALTITPTDIDGIVNTLQYILENKEVQTDYRRRGLHQSTKFSWERTAQETLRLYRKHSVSTKNYFTN